MKIYLISVSFDGFNYSPVLPVGYFESEKEAQVEADIRNKREKKMRNASIKGFAPASWRVETVEKKI